jgi:hypothetical protein
LPEVEGGVGGEGYHGTGELEDDDDELESVDVDMVPVAPG